MKWRISNEVSCVHEQVAEADDECSLYLGGLSMTIDKYKTEVNQNFSKVVTDFTKVDTNEVVSNEDVLEISKRLLIQNKEAYEVLAK